MIFFENYSCTLSWGGLVVKNSTLTCYTTIWHVWTKNWREMDFIWYKLWTGIGPLNHASTQWWYRSHQSCWLLSLEWLIYVEHIIKSLLNSCLLVSVLRSTPKYIPLRYTCPNNCYVGLSHGYTYHGVDNTCLVMTLHITRKMLFNSWRENNIQMTLLSKSMQLATHPFIVGQSYSK